MSVALSPCPFCGGPPVPIASRGDGRGVFSDRELENGVVAEAHVFCHECGARGEAFRRQAYDQEDVDRLLAKAVDAWNRRDSRNDDLYQYGVKNRLNEWPRPT